MSRAFSYAEGVRSQRREHREQGEKIESLALPRDSRVEQQTFQQFADTVGTEGEKPEPAPTKVTYKNIFRKPRKYELMENAFFITGFSIAGALVASMWFQGTVAGAEIWGAISGAAGWIGRKWLMLKASKVFGPIIAFLIGIAKKEAKSTATKHASNWFTRWLEKTFGKKKGEKKKEEATQDEPATA